MLYYQKPNISYFWGLILFEEFSGEKYLFWNKIFYFALKVKIKNLKYIGNLLNKLLNYTSQISRENRF